MAAGDEYFEDLLRVAIKYSGERNTAENIFYASCLGAHDATLEVLDTVAGDIFTEWAAQILPYISSAISLIEVLVSDWTSADGLTGSHTGDTAGSLTGDILTDQVASLQNYVTDMRYRGGRGRMYLPQPDATKIETGTTWASAYVADLSAAMETVLAYVDSLEIGDDLLTWVLYHRGTDNVVQGFEPVLSITTNPTPGTQRRRVRRVGHKA